MPRFVRLTLAAIALVLVFPATTTVARTPVKAVAAFSILADMTREIGGDRVEVVSLVPSGSDAHVFSPRPADVQLVSGADLVIENGAGFEGWIDRLIDASGYRGLRIVVTDGARLIGTGITGLAADYQRQSRYPDQPRDSVAHAGRVDPHAWHDLENAAVYVTNIRAGLCAVDPSGCSFYQANADRYAQRLLELDGRLKTAFAQVPPERRRIVTSHAGFGYFASRYGLEIFSPQGVSTGSDASSRDLARLIRQIRALDVHAYFTESGTNPRLLEQVARETGLKGGGVLFSDTLSGPDGPAPTFLEMIAHNARTILQAIGSDSITTNESR